MPGELKPYSERKHQLQTDRLHMPVIRESLDRLPTDPTEEEIWGPNCQGGGLAEQIRMEREEPATVHPVERMIVHRLHAKHGEGV